MAAVSSVASLAGNYVRDPRAWDSDSFVGEAENPLLGKGGVAARSRKDSRSFERADGVVCSIPLIFLEQTTPSAPFTERELFLGGAATPPLPRRGVVLSPVDASSILMPCIRRG